MIGRIPPQDTEIEKAVLSTFISYPKTIRKAITFIKPDAFYTEAHQLIYEALIELYRQGVGIDILILTDQLRRNNSLETVGGIYYLSQMMDVVSSSVNIEYHLRILQEIAMRRRYISIGQELIRRAYDDDVFETITYVQSEVRSLLGPLNNLNKVRQKDIVAKTLLEIDNATTSQEPNYLKTGIYSIDNTIYFSPTIMMVAGGSGIGKSTFITYLMKRLLEVNYDKMSILWYCIDHETAKTVNKKFLSADTHISYERLAGRGEQLSRDEIDAVLSFKNTYEKYDIEFVEIPPYIADVELKYKDFCEQRPGRLNILLLDNLMRLQDMRAKGRSQTEIDDAVGQAIGDIYKMNMQHNPLIIVMHHMTKEQFAKVNIINGMRPTEENVKGSGRLMDVVEQLLLLNRPGKFDMLLNEYPDKKDILSSLFITDIVKNTFGKTGVIWWLCSQGHGIYKELKMFTPE